MSAPRWTLSLLFIVHVTSITLASLPPPAGSQAVRLVHSDGDSVSSMLTPVFDRGARMVSTVFDALSPTLRPLRKAAAIYVNVTGLGQNWNMFSRPWTENRYARLRFYISASDQTDPTRTATQTIFPLLRQHHRFDVLRSYQSFAWDKAFMTAMERYSSRPAGPGVPPEVAPIVRHFADRYRRDHLKAGQRIVRTEVWLGASPVRRQEVLKASEQPKNKGAYAYDDPAEAMVEPGVYRVIHATETQDDISWRLEFIDE